MNNLKSIINDIESLQGRLRSLYRESEIIKRDFIALEKSKSKEFTGHKVDTFNIQTAEIEAFLKLKGRVSMEEMKKYFNCTTERLTIVYKLLKSGRLVKDGINDKGKDTYSLSEKSELATTF